MKPRRLIVVAFVLFAVAIPTYLILRKRERGRDLEADLAAAGYRRADCPPGEAAFGARMSEMRCWSGKLASGTPVRLVLATRWKAESANVPRGSGIAEDSFIGVEVPRADDAFVARWRARLAAGDDAPAKVEKLGDATLIAWRGLHTSELVHKRLDDVAASL